jgi:SPP1 family predicted phage head-tail adaptor
VTVFESLLNNTFTVSRRLRISDGQGGWTVAWAEIGTIEGRIRPASSAVREIAAQEGRDISHVLYLVAGADVARGDLVECGELDVEVQGVREPSLAGHHLEVDCLERQAESTEAGS